jgi:hypothetical protein
MAEAVVAVEDKRSLSAGDGEMPAGEAMEVGMIKSSRFIESAGVAVWSDECRNWAIPLGAFCCCVGLAI